MGVPRGLDLILDKHPFIISGAPAESLHPASTAPFPASVPLFSARCLARLRAAGFRLHLSRKILLEDCPPAARVIGSSSVLVFCLCLIDSTRNSFTSLGFTPPCAARGEWERSVARECDYYWQSYLRGSMGKGNDSGWSLLQQIELLNRWRLSMSWASRQRDFLRHAFHCFALYFRTATLKGHC